uniref:Uncharacterized protein n=1 Tax=Avena sativa TaxID=4498 RepID=A0ACD5YXJ2_AVESA
MGYNGVPFFRSSLSSPDLIPHERFFPPHILNLSMELMGCRHGRVLFFDRRLYEILVWDSATGYRLSVAVPPMFDDKEIVVFNAAIVCAASDEGHVHGDCHSSPFQVILIGIHPDYNRTFPSIYSSVYSSETRTWGGLISTTGIRDTDFYDMSEMDSPATLVGNSLYWLFDGPEDGMLIFDLDRQSLVCIEMPPDLRYYSCSSSFQVMPTDDSSSSLRLAILHYQKFEMWERKVDCDGVVGWVLQKTFQMNMILGLEPMGGRDNLIMGYDEDDHVIYVRTDIGVCMIQLETMRFKNLGKDNFTTTHYYPYRSFYTAVSDLAVCQRRVGGICAPVAKDDSRMAAASRGVEAVGGSNAAASSGTISEGGTFGKSKGIVQGMDIDLVPRRQVLMQTRIDVVFKKEMVTRSKLDKAWAKWFRANGIPGSKADCPHFRSAMKLTRQLGTCTHVPTGDGIDETDLGADEEELP